jgi:CDP-diacylglycerol--glycerol-3-phosphate 3-phosphatidyltransferase
MLLAAIIFLLASATDFFDGYIARKRGQITTLGVLLDPVADKLLTSLIFISLVQLDLAPAWMVVIIVGREIVISGLRNIASDQGFTIDASRLGKIKMVSQVAAITLLLLGTRYPLFERAGTAALYVVVFFALWSAVGYFRTFWTKIDDRFKAKERRRLTLVKKRPRRHAPTQ